MASDVQLGVPSQCLVARNAGIGFRLPRPRDQYIANVALKVTGCSLHAPSMFPEYSLNVP